MELDRSDLYQRRRQIAALLAAGLVSLTVDLAVMPLTEQATSGSASNTNIVNFGVSVSNGEANISNSNDTDGFSNTNTQPADGEISLSNSGEGRGGSAANSGPTMGYVTIYNR